jgi:hypothetical protein
MSIVSPASASNQTVSRVVIALPGTTHSHPLPQRRQFGPHPPLPRARHARTAPSDWSRSSASQRRTPPQSAPCPTQEARWRGGAALRAPLGGRRDRRDEDQSVAHISASRSADCAPKGRLGHDPGSIRARLLCLSRRGLTVGGDEHVERVGDAFMHDQTCCSGECMCLVPRDRLSLDARLECAGEARRRAHGDPRSDFGSGFGSVPRAGPQRSRRLRIRVQPPHPRGHRPPGRLPPPSPRSLPSRGKGTWRQCGASEGSTRGVAESRPQHPYPPFQQPSTGCRTVPPPPAYCPTRPITRLRGFG